MSATFERVSGPYEGGAGGIVWDGSALLFTAIEEGLILRFDEASGSVEEWRRHTFRTYGLALGPNGELYGCQQGGRRIVQFRPDGSTTAEDALLAGRYHNYPSDLTIDGAGRIWFTDPYSATLSFGPNIFPPLEHASVLRLQRNERKAWTLSRMTFDTAAPRALALSPDETTLYVAEGGETEQGLREIRAYPIEAGGALGKPIVLHAFGSDHRGPHRGAEGLCLDEAGNILACAGWERSGPGPFVYVFSPTGAILDAIPCPGTPMRCAFGGRDLTSLYVTTRSGELCRAESIGRRGIRRHPASDSISRAA